MSPARRWGASGHLVACAILAAAAACPPASAETTLEPGIYRLDNHGNAARSPFGQISEERVSRLGRKRNMLAFSFDHPSADVTLNLKQVSDGHYTLRVFGTAWGSFV